jgi:hypothetical protein
MKKKKCEQLKYLKNESDRDRTDPRKAETAHEQANPFFAQKNSGRGVMCITTYDIPLIL